MQILVSVSVIFIQEKKFSEEAHIGTSCIHQAQAREVSLSLTPKLIDFFFGVFFFFFFIIIFILPV